MGLSSANFGFAVGSNGQALVALKKQFSWTSDEIDSNTQLISTIGIGGIAVGSIIGGKLIQFGKRRMIILSNLCVIITSLKSLPKNWPLMVTSRFLFSFFAGIHVSMTPKILDETIPGQLMDYGFAASTNVFINIFLMIELLMGMGYPDDTDSPILRTTNYWQAFFIAPIPVMILALILNIFVFKQDSLLYHIQRDEQN